MRGTKIKEVAALNFQVEETNLKPEDSLTNTVVLLFVDSVKVHIILVNVETLQLIWPNARKLSVPKDYARIV